MRTLLIFLFLILTPIAYGEEAPEQLKVGIYLGTFDPPHKGHRAIARKAIEKFGFDILYILPNVSSPHKPDISAFEFRNQMVKLNFYGINQVKFYDDELLSAAQSGGEDRSAGFKALANVIFNRHRGALHTLVIGEDSYERYLRATNEDIDSQLEIALFRRSKEGLLPKHPRLKVINSDHRLIDTSSTKTRQSILNNTEPDNLIKRVLNYIKGNSALSKRESLAKVCL